MSRGQGGKGARGQGGKGAKKLFSDQAEGCRVGGMLNEQVFSDLDQRL